ncbi:YtxH domain-containing protein [Cytobacillus dafuensis]|uniref:YtxH domain-containing protein n=1 Tax=Cytobacillus dafuensis TaxID=1742359 RepID=UPI000710D3A8|nr:YtxH domain-containing protein [Cytobacillus dafuensis]
MGKSLFWKGVIFGAIAGGAVTLFDKNTRQSVMLNCKKATSELSYYVKNPSEAIGQVKEMTNNLKSTYEQVSEDLSFIVEKVEELKESSPQVSRLVEDTKDAFFEEDQDEPNNNETSYKRSLN